MEDTQLTLEALQMGLVYEAELGNEAEAQALCQQIADYETQALPTDINPNAGFADLNCNPLIF